MQCLVPFKHFSDVLKELIFQLVVSLNFILCGCILKREIQYILYGDRSIEYHVFVLSIYPCENAIWHFVSILIQA